MMHLAKVIVVLFVTLVAFSVRAQPVAGLAICSSEVAAVMAAALKHALVDVRDLPDLLIVERGDSVYVLNYIGGMECVVEDTVLPTSTSRNYVLLSQEEARVLADQRGETVAFARAGEVKFVEGEASVWVGASVQPAQGDERGLVCCCGGQMFLRRESGVWVFARWGDFYCA